MPEVNAHRHVIQFTFLSAMRMDQSQQLIRQWCSFAFFKQAASAASHLCQIPVFQMNPF